MNKTVSSLRVSKPHVEVSASLRRNDAAVGGCEPRLAVVSQQLGDAQNSTVTRVAWINDHVRNNLPAGTFTVDTIVRKVEARGRGALLAAARQRLADHAAADDSLQNLQAARLRAGLSQTQLAERLGSTQPSIARLEAGRERNPSLLTLRALCAALSVDMNTVSGFFGDDD